jgi:hypothetical protein
MGKDNLFNDSGATMSAGEPTPAAPKAKGKKAKSTKVKKVRVPRVKDQREVDLIIRQKYDLIKFKAEQAKVRKELRKTIRLETHPPKPSRVERIAASLKPEEKAALLAALQPQ